MGIIAKQVAVDKVMTAAVADIIIFLIFMFMASPWSMVFRNIPVLYIIALLQKKIRKKNNLKETHLINVSLIMRQAILCFVGYDSKT
jgi:p-aminobenzoyl-glutamate transporter AbgT